MSRIHGCDLGIMFRREYAPEALPDFARRAEAAGFDELWLVEDCFFTSGIAAAAVALASASVMKIGLGIMPAVARNPVFAAMEIATLARMFPGRFLPGFGHGVADWMRQIGAFPASQMRALEEVTLTTRRLLAGDAFSFEGGEVHLEQVELVHPPRMVPPVALGVSGPRSLELAGRIADGTILSEYSPPAYVRWARERIARGQAKAGAIAQHRVSVFTYACAATNSDEGRRKLRPAIAAAMASGDIDARLAPMGILEEVQALRQQGGSAYLETHMPDGWIDQLAIVGAPDDWRIAIERLADAGVQSIVLTPLPDTEPVEVERFACHAFA